MPKTKFLTLPIDIAHEISERLSPLSRANLNRAFSFKFTQTQKRSARVWDMIFKDESWIQAVENIKYDFAHPPQLTLVGYDLIKLFDDSSSSAYIALLVSDWHGETLDFKEKLFASLREYNFDQQKSEITFKNSNITLNINDVINTSDWILMKDPRKLFYYQKKKLQSAALYYRDDHLYQIGPEQIGGVEGISSRKKKCVKNICSLKLKFGDGAPLYHVFTTHDPPIGLSNNFMDGTKWITSWTKDRS
jgi:hypothetical protein